MTGRVLHIAKLPHAREVIRVWRANRIGRGSIRGYLLWVRSFHMDCVRRGISAIDQLREEIVLRWAAQYIRRRGTDPCRTRRSIHSALWAWSWGLQACGYQVPTWNAPAARAPSLPPLLEAFAAYRREVRGAAESAVRHDLAIVLDFMNSLRRRGRQIARIQVQDIDEYLHKCRHRLALTTLARIAYALRAFLRFLYASGRISHDVADAVSSPRIRRGNRPPRALPWADVRRILKAVDKTARSGLRDYALLLVMAVYGLGAGEARGLTLDCVDWRGRQLRVVRPKTDRAILLPLLPAVGRSLAEYLEHGRPRHCTARTLFVRMHAPYGPLAGSGAIRHVLIKHASAAGVRAPSLGSHVLRHSHACRQIDLGAPAAVVGDILGHRRPESTSAYVRVAFRRLRAMALPVPR
jgi:integrase/recombinase XerD